MSDQTREKKEPGESSAGVKDWKWRDLGRVRQTGSSMFWCSASKLEVPGRWLEICLQLRGKVALDTDVRFISI